MGNQYASDKHTFDMHLKVIGAEVTNFMNYIKLQRFLKI